MESSKNNIGFLRLIFASCVIISHSLALTGGVEPLASIFPGLTLGGLSVDGFFLLSGFLIAKSMVRTGNIAVYMEKRVLRIFPAFIAAYLLSVFVLGIIVHAQPWLYLPETALRLITLQQPLNYPGELPGVHFYPYLNGSMWTIGYEFRCYILISLLWATKILQRRWLVLGLTIIAILISVLATFHYLKWRLHTFESFPLVATLIGAPIKAIRLFTSFLIGTSAYLFRAELARWLNIFTGLGSGILGVALMLSFPQFNEIVLTTFGAILLFWISFYLDIGQAQKINDKWDISYGVYLYGWPVSTMILWFSPHTPWWALSIEALAGSYILGALSWFLLEKKAKDWILPKLRVRAKLP